MFNIGLDNLWPWIRLEPPAENPSGFRMASSTRGAEEFTLRVPSHGLANGALPNTGLDDAYSPIDGSGSFKPLAINAIPSFGGRQLSTPATSQLFPRLTEPKALWLGSQDYGDGLDNPADSPLLVPHVALRDGRAALRVAAISSEQNGSPTDALTAFEFDPLTGIDSNDTIGHAEDRANPFGFLDQRRLKDDPIPSFDRGSLPPYAASFLFPRMDAPQFSWLGLQNAGETDAGPNGPSPGFHFPSPMNALLGFHIATDIGANSTGGIRPSEGVTYPTTYPVYDPTYFPAPPRDPVKEALDQIARIYGIHWQDSNSGPTVLRGGGSTSGLTTAAGDAFDPRYIVPTGGSPPPGPRHNGGPPLERESISPSRSRLPRPGPLQAAPTAPQPIDNSATAAGAAAAPTAVAAGRQNAPAPIDVEADEKLDVWQKMVSARGQQAPGGQYLGAGGVNTWVGVRLNPKLPEPAAGYYYRPSLRHLRNGYRGELVLANRIVHALPNEIVIHYGMPAGLQGPDVISISPSGTISVWDSKWRTGQRSISLGQRAHQSEDSVDSLRWEIRRKIKEAVSSGHLSPDIAAMARRNVDAGNFDIYTIGTGNAHGGVAEPVRNSGRSAPRRQ